jgi:SAM-dependent methyltransferase
MTEQAHPEWDASYTADTPAPWDIGRPQPTFVRLADEGRLTGRLLDAGCGTGENALLAASRGADVTGIDVAPTAIARARAKASERGLTARFEIADALDLGRLSLTVDTVIDSGVFHVFGDDDRAQWAQQGSNLRPLACKARTYRGWTWLDVAWRGLMPVDVGSPLGSPSSLAPLTFSKHERQLANSLPPRDGDQEPIDDRAPDLQP